MFKKIMSTLLIFCMVFCISACDIEQVTSTQSTEQSSLFEIESEIYSELESSSNIISSEEVTSEEVVNTQDGVSSTSSVESKVESQNVISSKVETSSKEEIVSKVETSSEVEILEEDKSNLVWIPTNGGKKYHIKSSCSGMKNPEQVTKETAIDRGFGPCGRCY